MALVKYLLAAAASAAAPALAADRAHPTVLELFQSQGCSSCPPANATLNALADRPDVLALSFAVTYWDRLGWKDTFATPAFTARQWDYAHAGKRDEVSTSQMIVNGRGVLVGGNRAQVDKALRAYDRGTDGPAIARSGNTVTIGRGASRRVATVWLVRYDPRLLNVPIRDGENGGRTLPHRDIVRGLQALGSWTGAALTLQVPAASDPASDPAYRAAILVQEGTGGAIIAAARI